MCDSPFIPTKFWKLLVKHQEKKFKVQSFNGIQTRLKEVNAKPAAEIESTHYYAQVKGNDVIKLVDHDGHYELHLLKESDGKFSLTNRIPVSNFNEGLSMLKGKGAKSYAIVKMAHTDYEYDEGLVGLYVINDILYSVILDFPASKHKAMEEQFGLENAEKITIPYNKLLERMGRAELHDL